MHAKLSVQKEKFLTTVEETDTMVTVVFQIPKDQEGFDANQYSFLIDKIAPLLDDPSYLIKRELDTAPSA